jgi:DNA repair exonuclease SbcCD ATPase subunit
MSARAKSPLAELRHHLTEASERIARVHPLASDVHYDLSPADDAMDLAEALHDATNEAQASVDAAKDLTSRRGRSIARAKALPKSAEQRLKELQARLEKRQTELEARISARLAPVENVQRLLNARWHIPPVLLDTAEQHESRLEAIESRLRAIETRLAPAAE